MVLSSNRLYKDKKLSELCLLLLERLSDVLLPAEIGNVLSDIIPLCISLCNIDKQISFAFRPDIKRRVQFSSLPSYNYGHEGGGGVCLAPL